MNDIEKKMGAKENLSHKFGGRERKVCKEKIWDKGNNKRRWKKKEKNFWREKYVETKSGRNILSEKKKILGEKKKNHETFLSLCVCV